ncbi:MAG: hypothetical protein KJO43_05825 [Phycisphaerae bacterium]|nr:hypothetical protein [Phycisphaerae bacterium]NNF41501.1 hypothetical protein [Phycisphaerales bacterium]
MMCFAQGVIDDLASHGNLTGIIALVGGLGVVVLAIVTSFFRSVLIARGRERTKREIAAYVAQGSIDAEKAVAILDAGTSGEEA